MANGKGEKSSDAATISTGRMMTRAAARKLAAANNNNNNDEKSRNDTTTKGDDDDVKVVAEMPASTSSQKAKPRARKAAGGGSKLPSVATQKTDKPCKDATGTVSSTPATTVQARVVTAPSVRMQLSKKSSKPTPVVNIEDDDDNEDDEDDDDEEEDAIPLPKKLRTVQQSNLVPGTAAPANVITNSTALVTQPPPPLPLSTLQSSKVNTTTARMTHGARLPNSATITVPGNTASQAAQLRYMNYLSLVPASSITAPTATVTSTTHSLQSLMQGQQQARITPLPPPPPPPVYVTDAAAHLLREISLSDFTPTFLKSGKFTAEVLPRSNDDYGRILDFIVNSQAHNHFGVKLLSVMKVSRTLDATTPPQPSVSAEADLTMMLFHGTKSSVVASILEHGFRTPSTGGQMFGTGIYFADRVTKSAQYLLRTGPSGPMTVVPGTEGYLFLCEVRLGRVYNARVPNHSYQRPPPIVRSNGEVIPCDSLMCTGSLIPNRDRQIKIGEVFWPIGPTIKNTKFPTYTVNFNEFIVYDPNRVKIKYLIKVKITNAPYYTYT